MTSSNAAADLPRLLSKLRMPAGDVVLFDQGRSEIMRQAAHQAGVEVLSLDASMARAEYMNVGAHLAASRRKAFVGFCDACSILETDVIGGLLEEMALDSQLGVVAPAALNLWSDHVEYIRTRWDLTALELQADTQDQAAVVERVESDYCDLAFGLVRMSAWVAAGGFETACHLSLVDADFGLRVRRAGYSCAYLPQIQIRFDRSKSEPTFRSATLPDMRQLADKVCGHAIAHEVDNTQFDVFYSNLDIELHRYLRCYGMLDPQGPELLVSQPGAQTSDFLFTPFVTSATVDFKVAPSMSYKAVFATSACTRDAFLRAGIVAHHVSLGIETDQFNPFGARQRFYDDTTYLLPIRGQPTPSIRATIEAWRLFRGRGVRARLVILAVDTAFHIADAPDVIFHAADFRVSRYHAERIDVYESTAQLAPSGLAQIYRSVDFTIVPPDAEMMAELILETVACGIPAIYLAAGPVVEMELPNGLALENMEQWGANTNQSLSYAEALIASLQKSLAKSATDRRALARAGLNRIRNGLTWRDSVLALGQALDRLDTAFFDISQKKQVGTRDLHGKANEPTMLGSPSGISKTAAHKLRTAGSLATQAAATWEQQGLLPATRESVRRLSTIALHKFRSTSTITQTGNVLRNVSQKLRKRVAPSVPNSTLLIGYIDAGLGIGQSLRGLALALEAVREPFAIYPFGVGVESRRGAPYMPQRYDTVRAHELNIIEVAPNELNSVFTHLPADRFDGGYTILRTYWELGRAPESWRAPLRAVDELWVPNNFVASSFRKIFDKVITVVPPCIDISDGAKPNPEHSRDLKPFEFLFSFDFHSFPQRKNPLGVVRAFHRAFKDPAIPVRLTVKATGAAGAYPEIRRALFMATRHDPRIRIIDHNLERDAMVALIASADCYVSLHRSEGFGLGMVEAMAMAKPVIATAYSGCVDFIRCDTAFPVAYRLRPLTPGEYVEWEDQVWAEPDESDAAAQMRKVFVDRATANQRAQAGRVFVNECYGPHSVGHVAAARLAAIRAAKVTSSRFSPPAEM